jgi:anthranilate phosphoribosyltransferase
VREFDISPADAGLPTATPADLKGGTAQENAAVMREVLAGKKGPLRDVVLMNAAALLVVAGSAADLKAGVAKAAQSIDGGAARKALDDLVEITNRSAA